MKEEKKKEEIWVDLIKGGISSSSINVSRKEKNKGNGENPGII